MPASASALRRVQRNFRDTEWFVRRLKIKTEKGKVRSLSRLHGEQREIVRAFDRSRNLLIVKPRQIGCSTITQACVFKEAYQARDPVGVLTLCHESGAVHRMNEMNRTFVEWLPRELPRSLKPDNATVLGLPNGATLRQTMAGGRGQGRSYTYQILIATEMAFWPQGSGAVRGDKVDEDVWSSVLSTLHEGPYTRKIIESTGDGPQGIFYKMWKAAQRSREWEHLFFSWAQFARYRKEPPPDWKRTDEEEELAHQFGLDDWQLAWRRSKMEDDNYTRMRFRREYPLTDEDPFLSAEKGAWFDVELLNKLKARLPQEDARAYIEYLPPESGRSYFGGMDTAGGTGRDDAVAVLLRDDLELAAIWRSNTTAPNGQSRRGAQMSGRYNGAMFNVEGNKYGKDVAENMERSGVPLWRDAKGRIWWTQRGKAGDSKGILLSHARDMVDRQVACSIDPSQRPLINDPTVVSQLISLRENPKNGNIEAPEGHKDDHAIAYCLALWCARRHYEARKAQQEHATQRKLRRLHGARARR